ncbi:hypothetical protein BTJ39_24040 [Izhakiella australiensis]|uniref:DUF7666 domain-containing protein n=1 Tax=Izhakiella australiensis TaxID=1926881 RepID=A0A1S8Y3X2_9GAMM|nr:hypothetical protein [Izhakiella australiensis]OON33557.1 hypothetical protein BTJ39_24040 [Izhakiella australiensis]
MSEEKIVTYKGFNTDLTCRDYQFEIGKTYEHDGDVEACSSGFHACENPLDCFSYYPPAESRYAETISTGKISRHDDDTKIASATITIKAELSMPEFVQRAIDWIWNRVDKSLEQQIMTGNRSAASNTGDYSAASNTGDYSAASNTGYRSAASNTGNRSAASNTGDYSAASNTGNRSAASNTGDHSAASNTGNRSAAEVSGPHSVAAAFGIESKARASIDGAIVLCYRDDNGDLIHIRASRVGDNGIKADVWYVLDENGEFAEAE